MSRRRGSRAKLKAARRKARAAQTKVRDKRTGKPIVRSG